MNKIMENNEQVVEETTNTATDAEQVENNEGQEESKDWKAEALKYKAIAERKDKKLQQESEKTKETTNKPNTEQSGLSREEAIFFAKGGDEKDLALAKKIAEVEGISLLAACEDDLYKSRVEKRKKEEKIKANSIGASGSGQPAQREKTPGKMTREEHEAYFRKRVAS